MYLSLKCSLLLDVGDLRARSGLEFEAPALERGISGKLNTPCNNVIHIVLEIAI